MTKERDLSVKKGIYYGLVRNGAQLEDVRSKPFFPYQLWAHINNFFWVQSAVWENMTPDEIGMAIRIGVDRSRSGKVTKPKPTSFTK